MRKLALLAAAVALAACSSNVPKLAPGPTDRFFYPTGLGVIGHDLVVASSNADLSYADDAGGTVVAVDPVADPAKLLWGVDIRSFSGELAAMDHVAECTALASSAAVVPVRGSDVVYRLGVTDAGAVTCDGCEIPVGSSVRGDPFSAGFACGPGFARAYVGYLRSSYGETWVSQIDLLAKPTDPYVLHRNFGDTGQPRGFAYDAVKKRLYVTRTTTGSVTTMLWVDLANGCRFDLAFGGTDDPAFQGCSSGTTRAGAIPTGLELRSIALAHQASADGAVRRAYITARIFDAAAAASAGTRIGDFDGLLLVVDLSEDLDGRLDFQVVDEIPIGYGAGDVRVLPERPGKRDVVAALASDDGVVWIYDDETGARVAIGRNPETGAPVTGQLPFGLAADPVALAGNVGRVYVGSFREHFVTPIDVPLDAPWNAAVVISGGAPRRIGPQVTP